MISWDEMRQAFQAAKTTMRQTDDIANSMAGMLVGRLRLVDQSTLRELKKELRRYNPHTNKWS